MRSAIQDGGDTLTTTEDLIAKRYTAWACDLHRARSSQRFPRVARLGNYFFFLFNEAPSQKYVVTCAHLRIMWKVDECLYQIANNSPLTCPIAE